MPDASSLVNVTSVPVTDRQRLRERKKKESSLGILIWRRVMHSSSWHAALWWPRAKYAHSLIREKIREIINVRRFDSVASLRHRTF